MFTVKSIIEDISFSNELFEDLLPKNFDSSNPHAVEQILNDSDYASFDLSELQTALDLHNETEAKVTQNEIKEVYLALKNREKNPRGSFNKMGRFYVRDYELVADVRAPSSKYPYSQMNAARTAKFVKALAQKYKCQTKQELESVAFA